MTDDRLVGWGAMGMRSSSGCDDAGRPAVGAARPEYAHAVTSLWACPDCDRTFRRPNTRHACGVGDRAALLRGKRPELVSLYEALEHAVRRLGSVEIVTRDRYVLFRTTRIFTDL